MAADVVVVAVVVIVDIAAVMTPIVAIAACCGFNVAMSRLCCG